MKQTSSRRSSDTTNIERRKAAPAVIDGEASPVPPGKAAPDFDPVDAVARLLVGGTAELSDILLQQLAQWESNIAGEVDPAVVSEREEDVGDILRYLVVGLIFESQHRVRSSVSTAGSWLLGAASTTASLTSPIARSRLLRPARFGVSAATSRLESGLDYLVQLGRTEEFVGRRVAEEAAQETVNWLLDYLSKKPEIRDLIEQQGIDFAEEVTVGVRERMITGDNALEGMFRRLFGRRPRADLPGPPAIVQELVKSMDEPQAKPQQ